MTFQEISHTADVKIRVEAPTLDAAFHDAFIALMQVMFGTSRKSGTTRELHVESPDAETLLCDFLSEVIYLSDVESLVFSDADISISGSALTAKLHGEPFDPKRHSGGTEVKGISYSGLFISRHADGYMLDIIFDV